jgi:hypothetical protein
MDSHECSQESLYPLQKNSAKVLPQLKHFGESPDSLGYIHEDSPLKNQADSQPSRTSKRLFCCFHF